MADPGDDASPPKRRRRTEFEAFAHEARADLEAQLKATREQLDAIEQRIEKRTGRNLPMAILIGLVLGALVLVTLFVLKELFMLLAAALIGFTAFELASALRFAGRDVPRLPMVLAGVALVPATFYGGPAGQWLGFLAGVALVTVWRLAEAALPGRAVPGRALAADLGAGAFVMAYVPFLASFAVLLTAFPDGEWWTLGFLIVVVSIDTGAYATGLLFGRHPMAPRISPKKTWEGFAGSVVAAVGAGVLIALYAIQQPWWVGAIFGAVMVLTATVGDLTESLIKRDLGIKDISTWLPGHGGFLDRLDSILPSAAVASVVYLLAA